MKKKIKYTAKPNTWFDEGTEAVPLTEIWKTSERFNGPIIGSALFLGIRDGKEDEEVCSLSEFFITEEKE